MKLNSKVACTRHAAHHPHAEERVSKCKARRQSRRRASTSSLMHRDPEPLMMSPDHPDEFRAMKRITFYLLAALLCLAGAALAQEDDQEQKRLSAEILWQLDRLGEPVISPGGRYVVVPATSFEVDSDGSETRLWLLGSADEPGQRPISAAGASASSPVFSPDGSTLAFISKRGEDDAGQVYMLPMDAPGEATRLTEVPTGVSALKWGGQHIYFVSSVWPGKSFDEMAQALKAEKHSKVSAHVWTEMPYAFFDTWLDEDRENHLFRIPATGGEIQPLSQPAGLVLSPSGAGTGDYDVSSDESSLAIVADSSIEGIY